MGSAPGPRSCRRVDRGLAHRHGPAGVDAIAPWSYDEQRPLPLSEDDPVVRVGVVGAHRALVARDADHLAGRALRDDEHDDLLLIALAHPWRLMKRACPARRDTSVRAMTPVPFGC